MLCRWQPGMYIVFVSHEWLGRAHPDPSGYQLQTLRSLLRKIIEGSVAVEADIYSIVNGKQDKLSRSEQSQLANGYIWLDWFSVPQLQSQANRPDTFSTNFNNAILSIPTYVQRSDLFCILGPNAIHHDLGYTCDLQSWGKRGWCRVEMLAAVLAKKRVRLIVVRSAGYAYLTSSCDYLSRLPGKGSAFSCDEDRVKLYPVVKELTDGAIQCYKSSDITTCRIWIALQRHFFGRLDR